MDKSKVIHTHMYGTFLSEEKIITYGNGITMLLIQAQLVRFH
jgi:hypothetical protein